MNYYVIFLNHVNVTLAAFGRFFLMYTTAYRINKCFFIKPKSDLLIISNPIGLKKAHGIRLLGPKTFPYRVIMLIRPGRQE